MIYNLWFFDDMVQIQRSLFFIVLFYKLNLQNLKGNTFHFLLKPIK